MYEARGTEKLLHTPLRRNNEFTYTKIESVPFKKVWFRNSRVCN